MPVGFSWAELGVDAARVRAINDAPLPSGRREFVLYWCQITHRAAHNHALAAAIALGDHLGLPVVCYQALRPDYPHASDRLHAIILEDIADLAGELEALGIPHWVELPRTRARHQPRLGELGKRAAAIVSDLFPTFIIPHHLEAAARRVDVPLFAIDSACVVPMQRISGRELAARTLRPKLHKLWPDHLDRRIKVRAPRRPARRISFGHPTHDPVAARRQLAGFEVDHEVAPVSEYPGGRAAALRRLRRFVREGLPRYADRSDPSAGAESWLSPALHFGTLFAGEIAQAAIDAHGRGGEAVEAFLEELLVRRELAFNYCLHTPVAQQLSLRSLPAWAQKTLDEHRRDRREHRYTLPSLESAATDDAVWNAAQRQLRKEGRIHNYLRMVWGKRILDWSGTPETALARMAYLNDKYALDGRDPNSVANFMWILGLHDRPFQERPVIGKIRPMSSQRTREKFDLDGYLERYGAQGARS